MTDAEQVRRRDAQRYSAMLAGDAAALADLLDDELTYTHSSGTIDTKQSYLRGVAEKLWEYRSIAHPEERIQVRGDAALVFCRLQVDIRIKGVPKRLDNRALGVWTRAGGVWRLLALHSTPTSA